MNVAVVGKGRNCSVEVECVAYDCGRFAAEAGHVVITGGLAGVMFAAALGAHEAGGRVIGLLPVDRTPDARFPGVLLRTGLPEPLRNVVLASSCDAMLACFGSHGTLQEIAVALDREIPVASVATTRWNREVPTALQLEEVAAWLTRRSNPVGS